MGRIRLPILFGQHMMLQRGKTWKICGTADPEAREVRVEISGREILPQESDGGKDSSVPGTVSLPVELKAEIQNGTFSLEVPPLPAALEGAVRFFVNDDTEPEFCFEDVCIGDIWMACGQSNMEYFLRFDADWNRVRRQPENPMIRMFNVPRLAFSGQQRDLPDSGYWFREGEEAWLSFSAPGYAFARTIAPELNIPVGIVGCNWGGTPACAWMAEEYYAEKPLSVFRKEYEAETAKYTPSKLRELSEEAIAFGDSYEHDLLWRSVMYGLTETEQQRWMQEHAEDPQLPMGPWHHYRPSGLYHTMLRKAAPFGIRGFLWYQGESDSGHADIYHLTMQALVQCFRDTWEDQDLPFLFVQLAPFGRWLDCTGEHYTEVREAQEKAAEIIPNAWMASIMDLGSYEDIHPKFKMEVGRRLGLLALGHVYGRTVLCDPPAAIKAEICPGDGLLLRLTFSHAESGLVSDGHPEEAFEITAEDRQLAVRRAYIEGESLILETEKPAHFCAGEKKGGSRIQIRYAKQDYCETHLWNSAGLAAKPFELEVQTED